MNLSLSNAVLTKEQLCSHNSCLPKELESDLRLLACHYIQCVGINLKLPQVAMSTAQVLLQRFYYTSSMLEYGIRGTILGSIFLACKVEECPRRISDIINVYQYFTNLKNPKSNPIKYDHSDNLYYKYKDEIFTAELAILAKLGFNVKVNHPHAFMINYCYALDLNDDVEVVQSAWNSLNDCTRTIIPLIYQPSTIAAASIYLATRTLNVPLPEGCWAVFDVLVEDLECIAKLILSLYQKTIKYDLPMSADELKALLSSSDKSDKRSRERSSPRDKSRDRRKGEREEDRRWSTRESHSRHDKEDEEERRRRRRRREEDERRNRR